MLGLNLALVPKYQVGGVSYSDEVQQYFDRLLTPPTNERADIIAEAIDMVVEAGIWDKLDIWNWYAAENQGVASINIKSANHPSTVAGGPVNFVQDQGFAGTPGVNQWISVDFNPSTVVGANYTRNDAMISTWSLTPDSGNNRTFGTSGGGGIVLWPKLPSGNLNYAINGGEETVVGGGADASGFFVLNRTGANLSTCHRNDVLLKTGVLASAALVNENIKTVQSLLRISMFGLGGSLTALQLPIWYAANNLYMTGIGAV